MVKKITAAQLLDMDTAGYALMDVRTPMEYGFGTVKGAVNACLDYDTEQFTMDARLAIEGLDREMPVIVFCQMGSRSEVAARQLEALGFDVTDVVDGFRGYQVALASRF